MLFVVVVGLGDAVRVAAESQIGLLFQEHHNLEQRTEREVWLPKMELLVE